MTQEHIRVSIILPTRNGEAYIRSALDSIIAQSFASYEIIIVNDGSTDGTAHILDAFAKKYPRVTIVTIRHSQGIQHALAAGMRLAKGEYIARLDDDDMWLDPDKLAKQVRFLDTHPDHVLVGTGVIVVDDEQNTLFSFYNPETDEEIRAQLLSKNCFTHSSVVFRLQAARAVGGYSESLLARHVEDYDLWLRLGSVGKLANLRERAVSFMLRKDNISSKNKLKQFVKDMILSFLYRKKYPNYGASIVRGLMRVVFYGFFRSIPIVALKHKIFRGYKIHG